jgi:hypothetical protein
MKSKNFSMILIPWRISTTSPSFLPMIVPTRTTKVCPLGALPSPARRSWVDDDPHDADSVELELLNRGKLADVPLLLLELQEGLEGSRRPVRS